ncbi:hypothetical protein ABXZ88_003279 [Vibrio fluvialis]
MSRMFPELDKLAACNSDIGTIRSFLEHMSGKGYEFGQWHGEGFCTANLDLEEAIHEYFDVNLNTVEKERRQVLEQLTNKQ